MRRREVARCQIAHVRVIHDDNHVCFAFVILAFMELHTRLDFIPNSIPCYWKLEWPSGAV